MEIFKYPDYNSLSEAAGDHIVERLKSYETCLIGLSTGFSPKLTYFHIAKQLARIHSLVPKVIGFQLDEWYGLSGDNPGSCRHYIAMNVIKPWRLNSNQYFCIDGQHLDHEIQISEMKKCLNRRPMDICILGLGKNGHLALNEPGSKLNDPCRIVDLDIPSKTHKMLQNTDQNVLQGITVGIKEILESKELVLLVSGPEKKKAFNKLIDKAPIENFPASAIYHHNNWKCFVDKSSVNNLNIL